MHTYDIEYMYYVEGYQKKAWVIVAGGIFQKTIPWCNTISQGIGGHGIDTFFAEHSKFASK